MAFQLYIVDRLAQVSILLGCILISVIVVTSLVISMYIYCIMQIIQSRKLRGFRGLAFNHKSFPVNFFFFIITCFFD